MKQITMSQVYDLLDNHYGDLRWWPAKTPYEVMVGAVLTQNTAWSNVKKAIINFEDNLNPEFIQSVDIDTLCDIIRPSGFYNQKVVYLKELTSWYKKYNYSVDAVKANPLNLLRKELLAVKGIGKETADSILLYSFDFPTFVVDSYTKRLLNRLDIPIKLEYDAIKKHFEDNIKRQTKIYNQFHALIVINAQQYCKVKPKCVGESELDRCPLFDVCKFATKQEKN